MLRAMDRDNLALVDGVTTQQAGLAAYSDAVLRGAFGPGAGDDLLTGYLQGSAEVTLSLKGLDREAAQSGLGGPERRTAIAAREWQAWAQAARSAAERGQAVDPAPGDHLHDAFLAAELAFRSALARAEAAATGDAQARVTTHGRAFVAALTVEALVLVLPAAALMVSVLQPIARLTAVAGELAAGRQTGVPFSGRDDEVGSLAMPGDGRPRTGPASSSARRSASAGSPPRARSWRPTRPWRRPCSATPHTASTAFPTAP